MQTSKSTANTRRLIRTSDLELQCQYTPSHINWTRLAPFDQPMALRVSIPCRGRLAAGILLPHFRPCVLTISNIDCLCDERTTRRNPSRNARHADSANPGAGQAAARVCDRRADPTDLGGRAASGG